MTIHASCILTARAGEAFGVPPDAGVLLIGESGAGKSDLALRLMERGAMLVADDRTEIFIREGLLMARAAVGLAGLLEVRGLGILEFPCAASARIALAVVLQRAAVQRLPEVEYYDGPAALAVSGSARPPLLRLDPREGAAPAKILAAVAGHARNRFHNSGQFP